MRQLEASTVLNPFWLDVFKAIGSAGTVCLVGLFGLWLSGKKRWWLVSFTLALALLAGISLLHGLRAYNTWPVMRLLVVGRSEFVLLAVAAAWLLMSLVKQLRTRGQRCIVITFAVLFAGYYGLSPFVSPLIIEGDLRALTNNIDDDGMCLQQTAYNCGPAAAVTALHAMRIEAEVGRIAIDARTSPMHGTDPEMLCHALNANGRGRIEARCEYLASIDEMRGREPVIALVKHSYLVDHYVTVLEVTDDQVVIGDPLGGLERLSHAGFNDRWRRSGIYFERVP